MKSVTRHIWKDYEELADDARYTPKYQELYKKRKETIERVFADAKEKHAMRYTHYRGLAQVQNWVKLKFAAMNIKKFAKRKWNDLHRSSHSSLVYSVFTFLFNEFKTPTLDFHQDRCFSTDCNGQLYSCPLFPNKPIYY